MLYFMCYVFISSYQYLAAFIQSIEQQAGSSSMQAVRSLDESSLGRKGLSISVLLSLRRLGKIESKDRLF